MSDFAEVMEAGLRRLEIDIQVARDNLTTNPYLAIAALDDLEHGAQLVVDMFEHTEEVAVAAKAFSTANGMPDAHEVHVQLDALYEAGGVDLSHFNGTYDCKKHEKYDSPDGFDAAPKVAVLDIRVDRNGKVSVKDLTAEFAKDETRQPDFTI